MDLEQQLRSTYAERLGELDLPGGDVAGARRKGARMRSRRRAAAGIAALAVVAVAGGALLGRGGASVGPSDRDAHWRELPAAPLSPRTDALTVWTGHEFLVLGGAVNECPADADYCGGPGYAPQSDAAAYDPATERWRKLAPVPHAVLGGQSAVVVDGQVVVATNVGEWYDYDLARDRWTTIPTSWPHGGEMNPFTLSADHAHVYTFTHGRVHAYDVASRTFSTLPADRSDPRLTDTQLTATSSGLVLTGRTSEPESPSVPRVVLADLWDGAHWHRLPATGQASNEGGWTWTGTRMVDPDTFASSGDSARSRWTHPYPEGGIIDPAAGKWSPLPDRLAKVSGEDCPALTVTPTVGSWMVACDAAYDDTTGQGYPLGDFPEMPTVGLGGAWAGDRLMVFGGALHPSTGSAGPTGLSNRLWVWTP